MTVVEIMFTCRKCGAMAKGRTPHGTGKSCPEVVKMNDAVVAETQARIHSYYEKEADGLSS